jgi:hypothetical protein
MQKIVAELRRRNVDLSGMRALEVFGYTGERLTRHYAPFVKSLEIWELDPVHESTLRRNFPRAEVQVVDSYEQVRRAERRTYDFVVIDNHITPDEHFGLFPHIFRLLSESSVLRCSSHPTRTPGFGGFTPTSSMRSIWRTVGRSTGRNTLSVCRSTSSHSITGSSHRRTTSRSTGISFVIVGSCRSLLAITICCSSYGLPEGHPDE